MGMEVGDVKTLTFNVTKAFMNERTSKAGKAYVDWKLFAMIGSTELSVRLFGYGGKDYSFFADKQITAKLERDKDYKGKKQFTVSDNRWSFGDKLLEDQVPGKNESSSPGNTSTPSTPSVSEKDFLALCSKVEDMAADLGAVVGIVENIQSYVVVDAVKEVFEDESTESEPVDEAATDEDDDLPF
jgi:hypothetical protein